MECTKISNSDIRVGPLLDKRRHIDIRIGSEPTTDSFLDEGEDTNSCYFFAVTSDMRKKQQKLFMTTTTNYETWTQKLTLLHAVNATSPQWDEMQLEPLL